MDARAISDNPIRLGVTHRTLMVGPRVASFHPVCVASNLQITVLSRVPIIRVLLLVHLLTLELMAILFDHQASLRDASIVEISRTSCEIAQCSLLKGKGHCRHKTQANTIRLHRLTNLHLSLTHHSHSLSSHSHNSRHSQMCDP